VQSLNSTDVSFGMHQTPAIAQRSPTQLMRRLTKSIKLVVLTTVIGALAGAAISQLLHPRWLARMTIQIGQVSTPQNGGVISRPIENQSNAAVRYNLPGFRLNVVSDLGLPLPDSGARESRVIFDSMQATAARSPDMINLQVSAYSRQQAAAALMASFKEFAGAHQKMYAPTVSEMKRELDTTSAKLAEAERDYAATLDSARASTAQSKAGAGNDSRNVLVTNTATLINVQILNLKQQVVALQQAMSPMLTYPTRIVEMPYVPQSPTTPSKVVMIAAGAVLGLLAGVAFAARESLRPLRSRRYPRVK